MAIKPLFSALVASLLLCRSVCADEVAGAVHILVDGGGNTLSALVAGSIGKSGATAAANTDGSGHINVYAVGVGGTMTPSGGYLDNETQETELVEPPDNYSRVGIKLDYNSIASLDIYHYFDVMEDTITDTPGADFRYYLRKGWSVRSWMHPGTKIENYGVVMEYKTREAGKTVTVSANWYHQTQDYGEDPFYHGLQTDQDIFQIRLEIGR